MLWSIFSLLTEVRISMRQLGWPQVLLGLSVLFLIVLAILAFIYSR